MSTFDLGHWQRMFRAAPFIADLGAELVAVQDGRTETRLALAPRHLQHTGVVHAGAITTLADHSAGIAAQTLIGAAGWAITAEFKLSLLRGARGRALRCVGQVLKPGRSLHFTEADVWSVADDGTETLVARLSATMAVVPAERER